MGQGQSQPHDAAEERTAGMQPGLLLNEAEKQQMATLVGTGALPARLPYCSPPRVAPSVPLVAPAA